MKMKSVEWSLEQQRLSLLVVLLSLKGLSPMSLSVIHRTSSDNETLYNILHVKEDTSNEEIRASYRYALLNSHPDKLLKSSHVTSSDEKSGDQFMKVQKAWEILSNPRSRAIYDNKLRASRNTAIVADDVGLEDMLVEDSGAMFELYYQCRCGDYFSVSCSELEEMGYELIRNNNQISVWTMDCMPGSVILPCGSCSLKLHLLINVNAKVRIDKEIAKL